MPIWTLSQFTASSQPVSGDPRWRIRQAACSRCLRRVRWLVAVPVEGWSYPVGVQADEVEGHDGEHVLKVGLGRAAVTGAAGAGDGDGLPDGALHSGTDLSGLP